MLHTEPSHVSLDEMFENLEKDLFEAPKESKQPRGRGITLWVTADEKLKYDKLQEQTDRLFGKRLRNLVKACIAKASLSNQ
jgi:hypothetical protein